jgi:hypothetical protein
MDTIEITHDPRAQDDADTRQREKLAHRLEAVSKALDELRAEIELITIEIEVGPYRTGSVPGAAKIVRPGPLL